MATVGVLFLCGLVAAVNAVSSAAVGEASCGGGAGQCSRTKVPAAGSAMMQSSLYKQRLVVRDAGAAKGAMSQVGALQATVDSEGSSYGDGFGAQRVLADDGDVRGSVWLAPHRTTSWFIIDLGAVVGVSAFEIVNTLNGDRRLRSADRWTADYTVEASEDKVAWMEAAAGTLAKSLAKQVVDSTVAHMRYVRFSIVGYGGSGGGLGYFAALPLACSVQDGSTFSLTYPCACGATTCEFNTLCDAASSQCRAPDPNVDYETLSPTVGPTSACMPKGEYMYQSAGSTGWDGRSMGAWDSWTTEASVAACQAKCASVSGCQFITFMPNGRCDLQSNTAVLNPIPNCNGQSWCQATYGALGQVEC